MNTFTLEVLKILEKMIILGFYKNEQELIEILNPIIYMLDGSMDFTSQMEEENFESNKKKNAENEGNPNYITEPFKRDKELRYKKTAENEIIFAIKKKIIYILSKILDF